MTDIKNSEEVKNTFKTLINLLIINLDYYSRKDVHKRYVPVEVTKCYENYRFNIVLENLSKNRNLMLININRSISSFAI